MNDEKIKAADECLPPRPLGGEGGGEGAQKSRSRSLRKNQTDAERLLWRHLRNRNVCGFKFRRQHPIGPFIADFACVERGLIVELDGGQHGMHTEDDNRRSAYLHSKGFEVIRVWNDQVLKNTEAVLEVILRNLKFRSPSSRPSPPPVEKGENH